MDIFCGRFRRSFFKQRYRDALLIEVYKEPFICDICNIQVNGFGSFAVDVYGEGVKNHRREPYEDKTGKLILIGSKSPDDVSNPEKDALRIIDILIKRDRKILEDRYRIQANEENLEDSYDILLKIGNKRGFLKKGGEVDETKTAIAVIRDWQKGRLKSEQKETFLQP